MNKKALAIIVVIVVVVAGIGYVAMHKTSKNSATGKTAATTNSTSTAVNNAVLQTKTDARLGAYLTDPSGKALYTYGGDSTGVSNCTASCLASWPAYKASNSAALPANVTAITRSDNGQMQYAYKGMPLYYFVSDSGSSVTGNGVGNFTVARP